MAGRTRFQIMVAFLKPYDGQLIDAGTLRMLAARNLGTSMTSLSKHLENMAVMGLVREEEAFKFRVTIPADA